MPQNNKKKIIRHNVRFIRTVCPECCGRGYIYTEEPSPEYEEMVRLTEKQAKDIER